MAITRRESAVDKAYEAFCLNDATFYDSPMLARDDDVDFGHARMPVPPGWTRHELDDWLVYTPESARFPNQGWKIHSSASLADADKILQVIWEYCIPRRIAFKFVRSAQLLLMANGKYAHRGSSGKFVTIYPTDEAQLEKVLNELGLALAGFEGPYILSDLRWEDGPLYVRYGAFAERWCLSDSGELAPAIEDPSGDLVPDRRGTTFSVPSWVTPPPFLDPALAARAGNGLGDLPYRIEKPLHFSNGGGVYAAVDTRTDEPVVLKEARPHAGLAIDGSDAVARLENERDVLRTLAGLGLVPEVRDYFTLGTHHFMVLEYVEGTPLASSLVDRNPLALLGDDRPFVAYTVWALGVLEKLRVAVEQVHARGIVIGDLHPGNVLIRPDGAIVLIDLEIASRVERGLRSPLGDPAFSAPSDRVGFDIDDYAQAALVLSIFLPLTELIKLDARKARQFADEIEASFPVPSILLEHAVSVLSGPSPRAATAATGATGATGATAIALPVRLSGARGDWPTMRDSMARAILSSATPDRDDRLFPGDIAQFETGGLNLANGAAGVLLALDQTGAEYGQDLVDWLAVRATNPEPGSRFGFYDGLHGIAYALDALGRPADALNIIDICTSELRDKWQDLGSDLFSGLAGVGLNLAHFAERTGDQDLWQRSAVVAELLADQLGDEIDVATVSGGRDPYAGLLRGSSGIALLFLRLHDRFGGDDLLDLAAIALRQDLRRCVVRDDGAIEVNEGYRTMPYLLDGSIGIGMVLEEYLRRRPDERFAEATAQARVAASCDFYIESGLFSGRAGMILGLAHPSAAGRSVDEKLVAAHIGRLAWHGLEFQGSLAFAGSQLLRLSMDLATGTAGVLLAVGAALHDQPVRLPFLGPTPRRTDQSNRIEGGE